MHGISILLFIISFHDAGMCGDHLYKEYVFKLQYAWLELNRALTPTPRHILHVSRNRDEIKLILTFRLASITFVVIWASGEIKKQQHYYIPVRYILSIVTI